MPAPLRALTLWQPWGWALFHGKPVENRNWRPWPSMLGKYFAVHAGKTYDDDGDEFFRRMLGLKLLPPAAHAQGIIGVARLARVLDIDETPGAVLDEVRTSAWFFGRYGLVLADQVEFETPLPCKGAQGFWVVAPEITDLVRRAYATAAAHPSRAALAANGARE